MLTVIIPTHNAERGLVATLAALIPAAPAGLLREVIVADRGSSDATVEIADYAGCDVAVSDEPVGARLRAAARRARAPWLLFLRAGVVLDSDWIGQTSRFISTDRGEEPNRAAVYRPASRDSRSALGEAFLLMRAALGARPLPEQGLLIAKPHYDALDGHRASEDAEVDLLRRIGRRDRVMLRCGALMVG